MLTERMKTNLTCISRRTKKTLKIWVTSRQWSFWFHTFLQTYSLFPLIPSSALLLFWCLGLEIVQWWDQPQTMPSEILCSSAFWCGCYKGNRGHGHSALSSVPNSGNTATSLWLQCTQEITQSSIWTTPPNPGAEWFNSILGPDYCLRWIYGVLPILSCRTSCLAPWMIKRSVCIFTI